MPATPAMKYQLLFVACLVWIGQAALTPEVGSTVETNGLVATFVEGAHLVLAPQYHERHYDIYLEGKPLDDGARIRIHGGTGTVSVRVEREMDIGNVTIDCLLPPSASNGSVVEGNVVCSMTIEALEPFAEVFLVIVSRQADRMRLYNVTDHGKMVRFERENAQNSLHVQIGGVGSFGSPGLLFTGERYVRLPCRWAPSTTQSLTFVASVRSEADDAWRMHEIILFAMVAVAMVCVLVTSAGCSVVKRYMLQAHHDKSHRRLASAQLRMMTLSHDEDDMDTAGRMRQENEIGFIDAVN